MNKHDRHAAFTTRTSMFVLLVSLGLSGCERGADMTVESQDLGTFSAIDFNGAGKVNITVGAPSAVGIEGGARAIKHLRIYVENDTLVIRPTEAHWSWLDSPQQLTLNIGAKTLTSLETKGAGSVHITGLKGGEHRVLVAGAFNIEARGELDRLDITLQGAGNVDYSRVIAQEANVVLRGAGNIEVNPVKLLDAAVHGVGAVQYFGEPDKVESVVHGLGAIQPKNDRRAKDQPKKDDDSWSVER
jgi:hypothetical protein